MGENEDELEDFDELNDEEESSKENKQEPKSETRGRPKKSIQETKEEPKKIEDQVKYIAVPQVVTIEQQINNCYNDLQELKQALAEIYNLLTKK